MSSFFENPALSAAALWSALNVLWMLGLGMNVSRLRISQVQNGTPDDETLQRAVRAHGNNTEYVPGALVVLVLLAMTGASETTIHVGGGLLLLFRVLQAIGLQQVMSGGIPPARLVGNLGTWILMAVLGVMLLVRAL